MNKEEPEITLNDIHNDLTELIKWTKVSSYEQVRKFFESILDSDTKKIVYQLSDGKIGSTEVIKKAKSSTESVSKYWNQWPKLGIGESVSAQGGKRFKRSFDLEDFDLLPKMMEKQTNQKKKNEEMKNE
ncbi:hypothetical protein [Nitrosopumilus sp.]|uniref:hypothetical protein n=1 Tax=Nitrosopumilus sp. TaxID=2024843 RepID=UPI003D150F82